MMAPGVLPPSSVPPSAARQASADMAQSTTRRSRMSESQPIGAWSSSVPSSLARHANGAALADLQTLAPRSSRTSSRPERSQATGTAVLPPASWGGPTSITRLRVSSLGSLYQAHSPDSAASDGSDGRSLSLPETSSRILARPTLAGTPTRQASSGTVIGIQLATSDCFSTGGGGGRDRRD